MKKVILACYEKGKEFEEEMEFEDTATEEDIEKEWKEWVWEQVIDYYGWKHK